MLVVKPINDKTFQKNLSELCKVEFIEDSFAYYAAEWDLSTDSLDHYIGICQFTIFDNIGKIINLKEKEDIADNEAMIIMMRTCLSFMHRSGISTACIELADNNVNVIKTLNMPCNNDICEVDLDILFNTPCNG